MEIEVRPFPTQSVPEFAELAQRALNELFEAERPNRGSLYSQPRLVWPPLAVVKRYPEEEGLRALIRRYGWDIYLVGGVRALAETLTRILEAEPERADWIALTLPALWRGIRDWDLPEDRGKAKGVYGRDL
jgi:hypothetical protein